jgi:hypothetical protein
MGASFLLVIALLRLREAKMINIFASTQMEQAQALMSMGDIVKQDRLLHQLLDAYYGESGSEARKTFEKVYSGIPSNTMARILDAIHTHAEIANHQNPEQRVYREKDVVELLAKLGFTVDWKDGIPL